MSPQLRVFKAKDLVAYFIQKGFEVKSQKGSHIKLSRDTSGRKQILIIPNHTELATGTCKKIYRDAREYLSEVELQDFFFR